MAKASLRKKLNRRAPRPLALEARLMFDGAAVDTTAAAVADHAAAADAGAADASVTDSSHDAGDTHAPAAAPPAPPEPAGPRVIVERTPDSQAERQEIVFIDPVVANWPSMVEQLRPGVEVVLLDGGSDGLAQIAGYLQGRTDVDAIHVLSHGEAGQFGLGTLKVDASALSDPAVAQSLRDIGSHLSADADLLLYGCDIAATAEGDAFLAQLAALSGADVAASTDATGSSSLGGDWLLEARSGVVETHALDLSATDSPDFLLGAPSVTSVDDTTWTEGSGAMVVDSNINVTGGTSYDGQYVRFSLTNGQNTDVLGLNSAANVNAAGAISVSGSTVYVGDGSSRTAIGTIDATENGQAGKALKINFVSTFTNSSFETSPLTGWTAINGVVNLGVTNIAGFTSPVDPTNPSNSGGNDDDYPTSPGSYSTTLDTSQKTDGAQSLRLLSSGMTTRYGYDVVHGPAVYSDTFTATSGDKIYFDWRAFAGDDAYDVFGYLLNTTTGATTTVLNATGTSTGGSTAWATASATIPTTGTYRFVFVSGTYDYSGGRAAGASLYLDNVRVYGSKVNDAIVTGIARQVTFQALSDAPVTAQTRVFTVTAVSNTAQSGADTGLINVVATNDAPTLTGAAQVLTYTENAATTAIDTAIVVADGDAPSSFSGGYLQAQITANGSTEDQLAIVNQGTAAGQIGVSGSNVTYGGVVIGTISASANGVDNSALRIDLNASASVAATQALARAIGYRNTSDGPSTATRTVTYTLNDGGNTGTGSALAGTRTAQVNVTPVDDPAVLTLSTSARSYDENDGSFFVDAALTLTDVDSTTMNGAKVIIGAGFKASEDLLSPASGTNSDGITYAYDAAKGVLTLSGSATIAQYQAALRAVKYSNTSENPDVTPRTITFTLGNAVALNINGVNHYYEVVNGSYSWTQAYSGAAARTFNGLAGYLATITSQAENDFIREKLTADAWIGASDSFTYINLATGTTTYANQSAAEGHWYWVTGPEKGTRISDGNGNPVTSSGSYAFWNSGEPNNSGGSEDFGEIYSTGASPGRWNDLPNSSLLSYVVEYSDTGGGVAAFSKSLTVTPVRINDAPVISGSASLTTISEDAANNVGTLVSSLLGGATDPDGSAPTGIAVTAHTESVGRWQYSLDNGATWVDVGAVSNGSALLLRSTDRLRFVPDGTTGDTPTVTFKAWDRTDENGNTVRAGNKLDVTSSGGITAYSTGTRTGNLTVTAVNDAPTLDAATPALTGIGEDDTANGGQSISSLLGATAHDVDSGAQQGIAITGIGAGTGTWEYSVNGGSSWVQVGTVSPTSALLLRSTDLIRLRPDGQNGGSSTITYKAWDRTSGTQASKVDASTGGGTTAFSTTSNTASITVVSINDAPVLAGTPLSLAGINEDDVSSPGQTVASFLGATLSDVDSGAQAGIAIVGQSVAGTGHWEYDTGGGWTALGAVSDGAALLLRSSDRVRFVPDQLRGGTATLTVRGWDRTSGSAGATADASSNGGTTSFSSATAIASVSVTEINDAPVFTTSAGATVFTEGDSALTVGAGLVLVDDGNAITSATVRVTAGFQAGDVLAVATPGSLSTSYNAKTGVLTLTGAGSAATYQAALRSVTFHTSSDDPTSVAASRTLEWRAVDASNLTSGASNSTITVVPTADAPVITGAPVSWNYTEDDGARVIAPSITLADADDAYLSGATVVISGAGFNNDGSEALSANTTGTAISTSFDAATGTLTLSGTDSVANYQRVLRSVSYLNGNDYNNPGNGASLVLDGSTDARTFTWTVIDANSDGASGVPSYGVQQGASTTNVTLLNANETPQVDNIVGNAQHIGYVEGGAPATLEGVLSVLDDSGVNGGSTSIDAAVVRISVGLASGDELGIFDPTTLTNAGWTVTGTALSGTAERGGVAIAYAWSAADGEVALTTTQGAALQGDYTEVMQQIGFRSTSDDPTAVSGTRTLIWRVVDSFGEQSAVTAAQTSIIDITAQNDTASVDLASLPANGEIVYVENDLPIVLAPSLTLADPDDTRLTGATVTLGGAGFINSQEYLNVPGSNQVSAADWTLSNVQGLGIDASYDWASGTLSLSGEASLADYQSVLRAVTYANNDNDPTGVASTRTVTWTLTDAFGSRLTDSDGGGNDGMSGSAGASEQSSLTILPRNDAPLLAGLGGTVAFTEGGSAVTLAGAMTLADSDDANLDSARIWISGGFTAGDQLSVLTPGGLSVSYDASTGELTLSGTAPKTTYRDALRSVQFGSTSDDPTAIAPTRTISWQITDSNAAGDGALSSAVGSSHVDLTATDDQATVGGLPSNGVVAYTEGGSTVALAPSLTLSDPDDTTLAGATVEIAVGATAGDLLSVGADLAATGITLDPSSTATSLVFTGIASRADYEQVLRSIGFSSSSDAPTASGATRTVAWRTVSAFSSQLTDADGANDAAAGVLSAPANSNVTLTATNDAPALSFDDGTPLDATDAPVFEQGGAPLFVISAANPNVAGGLTIADVDDASLGGATVQITSNFLAGDVLSIATPAGWTQVGNVYSFGGESITVTYSAGSGLLTLSGTALRSSYETLLGNVQFQNPGSAPATSGASRALTWTVTDGNASGDGARSSSETTYLVIRDRNDAPTILPVSGSANYVEGDLSVDLPDIVITDPDPAEIVTAELTLSSPTSGTLTPPSGGSYDTTTGVWTITGTVANVNAALAAVRFIPATDNDVSGTIAVRVSDGGEDGATEALGTISLNVTPVNDAPVLLPTAPMLPTISEDAVSNAGVPVSAFRGPVTDVDSDLQPGIAITALTSGTGHWEYSVNGGNSWAAVGAVDDASALLLSDADRIRFVPDGMNATAATFTYRAWDGSGGAHGTKVDASSTGNAQPFSAAFDTASIATTDVNDAPVMADADTVLGTITEDQTSEPGVPVADLLASMSDVDTGAMQGMAITGLSAGNGTWQYSIDDGATWAAIGTAAANDALLLRSTDRVRFVPDGRNATVASFDYRAWDRTSGVAGGRANVVGSAPSAAWSVEENRVAITVTAVNDAPVLTPGAPLLTTLDEDYVSNPGDPVSNLIGNRVEDVDAGAQRGIAVTSMDMGNGHWEFSLDDGATWQVIAPIAANTALLLRDTDRVRFMPNSENGTVATFHFRAWDRTAGAAGSVVAQISAGDDTPFSDAIDVATLHADGVNDAPVNDVRPTFDGEFRGDGTLRQDGLLQAHPQLWHDVDFGDPETTFRYQWEVADDAQGGNLRVIDGATAADYRVTAAEIGKFVRVKVYGGDGQVETVAVSGFTRVSNQAPQASVALVERETTESVPLDFTVPAESFTDADPEDTLYFTATLADGSPLPAWLTFDPATRRFSGTPAGGDVGVLNVRVTASDHGLVTASSDFVLRVLSVPVNLPDPGRGADAVARPLAPNVDLSTPAVRFGSGELAPPPAPFAMATGVSSSIASFTGSPDALLEGDAVSRLLASTLDRGYTQDGGFRVPVDASSSSGRGLFLVAPMRDQFDEPGTSWRFTVPNDTFRHTDPESLVILLATRADGTPLPRWLRFDARSGEFHGEPPPDFEGTVEVRVTARDNHGNEAVTLFRIHVQKPAKGAALPGRAGLTAQLAAHRPMVRAARG